MSFSFDKVTTGTYNFAPVILNFAHGVTLAGLLLSASLVVISAKM